jgi:hypothetical protein
MHCAWQDQTRYTTAVKGSGISFAFLPLLSHALLTIKAAPHTTCK